VLKFATCLLLLLTSEPLVAIASEGDVAVYRDGWGVPHIYAETEPGLAFGFGYAQAEDRLTALLSNYLRATGRLSEAFGEAYVNEDLRQRIWEHGKISREEYPELSPRARAWIEGFVAGVGAYLQAHRESAPPWAFVPAPHHVVALGRYLAWRSLEQQARSEYDGVESPREPDEGNAWAVSPARSADDAAVLCIDPFDAWAGPLRWYEVHLHGGGIHAFGFARPGLPAISVGHTDHLAWSALPGGVDCADVYALDLESPRAARYYRAGTWHPIRTDTVRIQVNGGVLRTPQVQRTPLGPVFHRRGRQAFVYRVASPNAARQVEQLILQISARNLEEFRNAVALSQMGPQRLLVTTSGGDIAYIRSGPVPARSEAHRWDCPAPGNAATTSWHGPLPQQDLIQILNPPGGWIQDCGTSPDLLTPHSIVPPDRHAPYVFHDLPGTQTPRSQRARELLTALSRITLEEAQNLALDTYIVGSGPWRAALATAWEGGRGAGAADPVLAGAVETLMRWDGRADHRGTGLSLYAQWLAACRRPGRTVNVGHILSRQALGGATRRGLLSGLHEAAASLVVARGRVDLPWGRVSRLCRSGKSWAVSGSAGHGLACLRTVSAASSDSTGCRSHGQSCTTIVLFRRSGKPESYSAVPYGQSDIPGSPHAWDQAAALFSQSVLKPNNYLPGSAEAPASLRLQHRLAEPEAPDCEPRGESPSTPSPR